MSRGDGQGSSGSHYIRGSQLRRHIGTDQIFIVLVFLGNLEGGGMDKCWGGVNNVVRSANLHLKAIKT